MLLTIAVAAVYYATGRLGLLLAIAPGYATPVWPPSGIALATCLLYGARAGPGVVLGGLLIVLTSIVGRGEYQGWHTIAIALWVGCGAFLQASFGARLIRRTIGFPNELGTGPDVARFLLFAGPISSLVNATWSGIALCVGGLVPWTNFAYGWSTWWCGDSIGALAITPIVLLWKHGPRELRRRRRRLVAAPLAGGFAVWALVFLLLSQRDQRQIELRLEERSGRIAHEIESQLQATTEALFAIHSFVANTGELDRARFTNFASDLVEHHPELAAIEWIPRVGRDERAEHEVWMRAQWERDYFIGELGTDGRLHPAGERTEYMPVAFVEPERGNLGALGFDLGSEAMRRKFLASACDDDQVAASPPLQLVQDEVEGLGTLLAVPVYGRDRAERPGYVLAVLRVRDLVRRALTSHDSEGLEFILADVTLGEGPRQLCSTSSGAEPGISWSRRIGFGGREWSLSFTTPSSFLVSRPALTAWLVLAGGMLLTSALGGLLLVVTGRAASVERLAQQRALEIRRKDEENEKTQEQLRHMQKLEVVGRLAGGVAHDLNNLLMVIQGYDELLLEDCGPADPRRNSALEIRKASERAALLVRRLLAFARKQVLQPRVVDVNELLKSLEGTLLPLIGVRVTMRMQNRSRGLVVVDPGQLEQVVMNLAVNARDALLPAGGELTIETEDRTVASDDPRVAPGNYVVISVIDRGSGMTPEVVERMFEPFFTTKKDGTGLGLATVYGIVQQSGGQVTVDSRPHEGATFRVFLPRSQSAPARRAEPDSKAASAGSGTILVVDDEPAVQELIASSLRARGYEVLSASNGPAAVELARRAAALLDLVVTDIDMPELSGPDVAQRIRHQLPDVPVLFMSGHAGAWTGTSGNRELETNCLQKPFGLEELARRVHDALRGPAQGAIRSSSASVTPVRTP